MKPIFTILLLVLSLTACNQQNKAVWSAPQELNDGWEIAAPGKAGFDQQELGTLISNIPSSNPKIDGIVIARHGKLIVDQYFNGYAPDRLHKVWSLTKPITGVLIGIAADKGLLSEKDPVYKYLGDYIQDTASSKAAVTIEHLITMTSGFEWTELGGSASAGFQLAYAEDMIRFTLDQPHTNPPGKVFNYSTGNSMVLAPIIKKATGWQATEFADEHLFGPLGITNYEWDRQSEFWEKTQGGELPGARRPTDITYKKPFADLSNTGSGLRMRPRDLCKFGQLHLSKGRWNGQQVVSESWVIKSTQPHFGNADYGYHWRLMNFEGQACYYATGFGLQKIYVFPALPLVVVMTQQHYETMPEGEQWTNEFLSELLEAIKNEG